MSDTRESTDSEREMRDLSEEKSERTEAVTKGEDFPLEEKERPQLNVEGDLGNNGDANPAYADPPTENEGDHDRGKDSNGSSTEEESNKVGDGSQLAEVKGEDVRAEADKFDETGLKDVRDVSPLREAGPEDGHIAGQMVSGEGDEMEEQQDAFSFDLFLEGDGDGTEEEQAAFMRELERFHKEKGLEFKPPKFYREELNCLKLWREVTKLGGYDLVTSCKFWRQVGESFNPPKTCTTVSWSFRIFYEKALLEYERHKIRTGEFQVPAPALPEPMAVDHQIGGSQASGTGRARRDAAARAMQGWHSRLLGNGDVGEPIMKDKTPISLLKRDKHHKSVGGLKRKKTSSQELAVNISRKKIFRPQVDTMVVDVGQPANWVKINVKRTKDCFEVFALVPGLLREEVHVQSDPAGQLIISGEPEKPDNPWGVTPFKKVVTLPSRIDPHQTSAVVTLHGQLFVRAPFG